MCCSYRSGTYWKNPMVCCYRLITASASGGHLQRFIGFLSHNHVTQLPWPKQTGPGSPPDPKTTSSVGQQLCPTGAPFIAWFPGSAKHMKAVIRLLPTPETLRVSVLKSWSCPPRSPIQLLFLWHPPCAGMLMCDAVPSPYGLVAKIGKTNSSLA